MKDCKYSQDGYHTWKKGVALEPLYTDGRVVADFETINRVGSRGATIFPASCLSNAPVQVARLVTIWKCTHCGKSI